MQIQRYRGSFIHTLKAIESGTLTIGFIGGSITTGQAPHNWPEPVTNWFSRTYPGLRVIVENAGIGATGSDLAVFRARRDLIARGCDLVFVEFAVNDYWAATENRMRSREGLLRKLIAAGNCDVVLVYTYNQPMYADMSQGRMPASIAEFEQLAEHYRLSSIWMALNAYREVQAGAMTWEEWLPDGLHPQYRGSLSYAQSVIEHLQRQLRKSKAQRTNVGTRAKLPAPLNSCNWEGGYLLEWKNVKLRGPWALKRSCNSVWMDQVLTTSALGAKLSFEFTGRGLCLGFEFGKLASEYRYRIDEGEVKTSRRDRADWVGPLAIFQLDRLADDLPPGRHHVEIEVIHGDAPGCEGTHFHLAFIGVLP